MAEKTVINNIKSMAKLREENGMPAMLKGIRSARKRTEDILKNLAEKSRVLEEAERIAALEQQRAQKEAEAAEKAKAAAEAEKAAAEQAQKEERARAEQLAVEKAAAEKVAEEKAKAAQEKPVESAPAPVQKEKPQAQPAREQRKEYVATEPRKREYVAGGDNRREFTPRDGAQRPPYNRDGARPQGQQGARQQGQGYGARQQGNAQGRQPQGGTFRASAAPAMPAPVPTRGQPNKKKQEQRVYEEKRTVSKRGLIKPVTVADFDEDRSGYRKLRTKKQKTQQEVATVKITHAVINSEIIPLKVLSEKIGISAVEITKRLFKEGIMKTINDSIDYDTAGFIAADLGIELELKMEKTAEEVLSEAHVEEKEDDAKLVRRPPVVTVMGHVDHGKTSLLDRIRSTSVTSTEAGGITQHIGAYTVGIKGKQITFLDTPGHAAFTAMRARGAQVTDIAVLVVAADDGVMPQTIEAINHAKAANVSIIVAINKMDKQDANPERIKQQLADHGVLPEEWGGDAVLVPVSAKTGMGFEDLLEAIQLVAEVKDLKANPDRKAKGVVVEAKLDKGKGPVATVLVQNGTLKTGDFVVSGTIVGKIRAMIDDKGRTVKEAGPSVPVSILGLEEVPNAGDVIFAVADEKFSKQVAEERRNKEREERDRAATKVTLDDVFNKIAEGNMKTLNLIVKADVQGSAEAVKQSMIKLSNDEVRVNVIHSAAGAINESDIMLADSSKAIIIGFNVRPDAKSKVLAERSGVDVKLYRVIYEAIDDVTAALKGMLAPKYREVYMGKAEVRQTFRITGVGMVAGCYVTEGKIVRNGKLRIYREDVMICEGNVLQLKRFKDDVKEVASGYECGLSIENFNDIKDDDIIECYVIEEIQQ